MSEPRGQNGRVSEDEAPAYLTEVLLDEYSARKKRVHKLLHERRFGNKLKTWLSYEALLEDVAADRYDGLVTVRTTLGPGGPTLYEIPIHYIPAVQRLWKEKNNISVDKLIFNENAPDEFIKIQGYVKRTESGLEFWYSKLKTKMNLALKKDGKLAYGLKALALLTENLDPSSFENLEQLMEDFPDRVIECSCYEIDLGNIPNRNTIFWEARDY